MATCGNKEINIGSGYNYPSGNENAQTCYSNKCIKINGVCVLSAYYWWLGDTRAEREGEGGSIDNGTINKLTSKPPAMKGFWCTCCYFSVATLDINNALNINKIKVINTSKNHFQRTTKRCAAIFPPNLKHCTFTKSKKTDSLIAPDVTPAMLVERTIAKKVFWEFDSIIMQNLSYNFSIVLAPTWPSYHVSAIKELVVFTTLSYHR